MILTKCASCAAPLPPLTAKQCSRCKTRYCGSPCQTRHWIEGGHKDLCKKIKRGGGAEQYNADRMYKEFVVVAGKECEEDTKDETCYICTEGAERRHTANEGLVRGCSCRGSSGFAHVACLVQQAKVLIAYAEEDNLDYGPSWIRWNTCGLCKQDYHSILKCVLGWVCWKTYLGRPEGDLPRIHAMNQLGSGRGAASILRGDGVLVRLHRLHGVHAIDAAPTSGLSSSLTPSTRRT